MKLEINETLSQSNVKTKESNLFMMHINIRSFPKNIDKLTTYIAQLAVKPDIIAITETKLNDTHFNINLNITGYSFMHKNSLSKEGGIALYLKKNCNLIN